MLLRKKLEEGEKILEPAQDGLFLFSDDKATFEKPENAFNPNQDPNCSDLKQG